jgi:undecaprenyl diphosphate synthase
LNSKSSAISGSDGLDTTRLPAHVAIIMDGNGRWAQKRSLSRLVGHEKGSEAVRRIVRTNRELGIPYLTLYAFSTENWDRPQEEVRALMSLLKKFLLSEKQELLDNGIRLNTIGQTDRLPEESRNALLDTMNATRHNTQMVLTLALSYGGRAEILKMVKTIAAEAKTGALEPDRITEETISSRLYTAGMPDPDLLIRTSGEMRISNFLLWQIAYAEIYITDTLWPDFDKDEYSKILKAYQQRDRRFGRI